MQGYDGTSWATRPSMSSAQNAFRGTGGTSTATYAGGGYDSAGNNVGTTQDFTGETSVTNITDFTTS